MLHLTVLKTNKANIPIFIILSYKFFYKEVNNKAVDVFLNSKSVQLFIIYALFVLNAEKVCS